MKKQFIMLMLIGLVFVLSGCKKEKVNIDFIIYDTTTLQVDKGSIITKHVAPFKNYKDVFELYYDEAKTQKYNNERIKEDKVIYVTLKENAKLEVDEELVNAAKQAYVDNIENLPYKPSIETIVMDEYLGTYDGKLVGVFYKKNSIYIDTIHYLTINRLCFNYSWGHEFFVYENGKIEYLKKISDEFTFDEIFTMYCLYRVDIEVLLKN